MAGVEYESYQGRFISGQTVTRDAQGRVVTLEEARVGRNTVTHTYGYNLRGELIADNESVPMNAAVTPQTYTYAYDAIGNRTQVWNSRDTINSAYTANNLNQYTAITTIAEEEDQAAFIPAHDEEGKTADGCKAVWTNSESLPEGREAERRLRVNQTLILTGTGDWQVTCNADNRPITFTQDKQRIENKYDYQSRRVEKALYQNGQLQKRLHFIYNGYLQIAALDTTNTSAPVLLHTLHWDPTEPEATRPLVLIRPEDGDQNWYEYTHTLNKNIANLTDKTGFIVAHYDYDAYGNQTEQPGPLAEENPFRFSSEYFDEELGLIYYNYRHYNPKDGRWINRDPIAESGGNNLYGFVGNNPYEEYDFLGMSYFGCIKDCYKDNDLTGTIIDNIVSYLTGASIPKEWVAKLYDTLGMKKQASLTRIGRQGAKKVTTLPSALSTALRAGGRSSLRILGRMMGPIAAIQLAVDTVLILYCSTICWNKSSYCSRDENLVNQIKTIVRKALN